jgi:hypothetical protein
MQFCYNMWRTVLFVSIIFIGIFKTCDASYQRAPTIQRLVPDIQPIASFECPQGTFVYHLGSHCCRETTDLDGKQINYRSKSCNNHNYIRCPGGAVDGKCADTIYTRTTPPGSKQDLVYANADQDMYKNELDQNSKNREVISEVEKEPHTVYQSGRYGHDGNDSREEDSTIVDSPSSILANGEGKELEAEVRAHDRVQDKSSFDLYIEEKCAQWSGKRNDECKMLLTSKELEQGITLRCLDKKATKEGDRYDKVVYAFLKVTRDNPEAPTINLEMRKYFINFKKLKEFRELCRNRIWEPHRNWECIRTWKQEEPYNNKLLIDELLYWNDLDDQTPNGREKFIRGCWLAPVSVEHQLQIKTIGMSLNNRKLALLKPDSDEYKERFQMTDCFEDWRFTGDNFPKFDQLQTYLVGLKDGERWVPSTPNYERNNRRNLLSIRNRRRKLLQQSMGTS